MKRGRSVKWVGIIGLVAAFSIWGIQVFGIEHHGSSDAAGAADIVSIDAMAIFGDLERPAVQFQHDKHTEALKKQGKDCTSCHLQKDGRLQLKFKRTEDSDRQTVMDIYHDNCITCHRETTAQRQLSGPVECGGCHVEKTPIVSAREPMGFDKSLHFRHSKTLEDKCEACHHDYNEDTKKLFYNKGQEGSCRYCHKDVTEKNRIAMSDASHQACVTCHLETVAKNKKSGPVNCGGCHDLAARQKIETVSPVPRMKRNQPDTALIKAAPTATTNRMDYVPFNHKGHETYVDNCRVCHHADMKTCHTCHTLEGSKEGANIRLEQAMHAPGTEQSCLGCHEIQKQKRECAGCHSGAQVRSVTDNQTCAKCHAAAGYDDQALATAEEDAALAADLLAQRPRVNTLPTQADIPEKVIIKTLEKKYHPVEMPHRKIVNALMEEIKEDNLAASFHDTPATLCQGCHHNSPATLKPPSCGSCHSGQQASDQTMQRLDLLGAYHVQCMECHSRMEITKPAGCTECHKEK